MMMMMIKYYSSRTTKFNLNSIMEDLLFLLLSRIECNLIRLKREKSKGDERFQEGFALACLIISFSHSNSFHLSYGSRPAKETNLLETRFHAINIIMMKNI